MLGGEGGRGGKDEISSRDNVTRATLRDARDLTRKTNRTLPREANRRICSSRTQTMLAYVCVTLIKRITSFVDVKENVAERTQVRTASFLTS